MTKPRALILHATGTNRDHDSALAIEMAGAIPEIIHVNQLRSGEKHWGDYQMLVIPGGFSYADALGAGKLLAVDLMHYFSDEVRTFISEGKPVIGICNGFQVLIKTGILPGWTGDRNTKRGMDATLTFNACGHFECRWVTLKAVSEKCLWTAGLTDLVNCPVAHGEGNLVLARQEKTDVLRQNDQIAFVYVKPDGRPAGGSYPDNPNGSIFDIAGICNPEGNVLGLMPHPENHLFRAQHPSRLKEKSGLPLFRNGVYYSSQL